MCPLLAGFLGASGGPLQMQVAGLDGPLGLASRATLNVIMSRDLGAYYHNSGFMYTMVVPSSFCVCFPHHGLVHVTC